MLREYDIRGIVGQTLGAADAHALGRAYATLLRGAGGRRVGLGFDGRLSSPELAAALGDGLRAGGIDVLAIGRGPTPMLYFAVHHLNADGGIQVTGSHNPPDHNGFKMMLGKKSLFGERIQELGRIAASGELASGAGRLVDSPVFDAYVERLLKDFRGGRDAPRGLGCRQRRDRRGADRALRAVAGRATRCCTPRSTGASRTITRTRRCPRTSST